MDPRDKDRGVICVVLERFTRCVLPRTRALEIRLAAGLPPTGDDVEHLGEVLAQIRQLQGLLARNPEYGDLSARAISYYSALARRAHQAVAAAQ